MSIRSRIYDLARLAILAVLLAWGGARPSLSQQPFIRPYNSESDLWEALREGEITFDEYAELLELARVGADSALIQGSDWEALPGAGAGYLTGPDTSNLLSRGIGESLELHHPKPLHWRTRSGYDGTLTAPAGGDGYTTARFQSGSLRGLYHWRHDGEDGRWERRVIEYRYRGARLQAGNVEPRFGRGLVIGRRSRLVGASEPNRTDGDWWQPALSRFNGAWLSVGEHVVTGDLLVSDIRSDQLAERMAAAQVAAQAGVLRAGISALTGTLERRDTTGRHAERVAGAWVHLGREKRVLLAEVAIARNGAAAQAAEALWRFERGQFHARAWHYASDFVNLWGGGPGHSDVRTVILDEIEERYSSRTAGERGFDIATRIEPSAGLLGGRLGGRWEWMSHREEPAAPLQHTWTARAEWNCQKLSVRPFVRGTVDDGAATRHAFGSFLDYGVTDRRASARIEAGRHHADADRYVRCGAGVRWRLNPAVRLEPAARWVDPDLDTPGDGYWYLYFTETILPAGPWRIEAALVWQRYEDRGRGDVAELRVRVVAGG